MAINNPKKFVQDLELAFPVHMVDRLRNVDHMKRAMESATEGTAESYLDNKSIISFAAEVTGQNRSDILNSTLIAQLAANKKYPNELDIVDWYTTYMTVLSNIGWVFQVKDFTNYNANEANFEMKNAVVELVAAAIGQNAVAIVLKTLDAIKKLSDSDNKIIAFERNTHSLTKGSFQVGMASQSNGAMAVRLGSFILQSEETITQILFFKGKKEMFSLKTMTIDATLNDNIFGVVRKDVVTKLGAAASKYISELEIDT